MRKIFANCSLAMVILLVLANACIQADTWRISKAAEGQSRHWLGEIDDSYEPWVYRPGLGWLYLPGDSTPSDQSSWLYSPTLGWVFSSGEIFPFFYRLDSASWFWMLDAGEQTIWFFDFTLRAYWQTAFEPPALLVRSSGALWQADSLLRQRIKEIDRTDRYPIQTSGKTWKLVSASDWTAGFWPGILWQMYEFSGDSYWGIQGQYWLSSLESQKNNTSTHDLGFLLLNSYGHAQRLTGRTDYTTVLQTAASSLMTRYSSTVGALRSWSWGRWDDDNNFTVIIDNLMNLELLTWAANHGGRADYLAAAVNHAQTTARDFFRTDGGTRHVVIYDQQTGQILERTTHQGYSANSTWARGQAWAMYGFTVMFRETQISEFLHYARQAAGFFLQNLPSDGIPYWDFNAPGIPSEPRDSSAAAIAASTLLELATLDAERADHWLGAAEKLLGTLLRAPYWQGISGSNALLGSGSYNVPQGNSNTAVIWGDYYLVEALLRYHHRHSAIIYAP